MSFYTVAFDLGLTTDSKAIANRVLKSRLGVAAVSPSDGVVRLGPGAVERERLRNAAGRLTRISQAMDSGNFTVLSIADRVAFHRMRIGAQLREVQRIAAEAMSGGGNSRGQGGVYEEKTISGRMAEVKSLLERAFIDEQITLAVQTAVDNQLYSPIYLGDEPFVRLELQPFRLGEFDRGSQIFAGKELGTVEVFLYLHKSGIGLLTIALPVPDETPLDLLSEFAYSRRVRFTEIAIPEPVFRGARLWAGARSGDAPGEWLPEIRSGVRWRLYSDDEPGGIDDIVNLYVDALRYFARSRSGGEGWYCWTTLFIRGLRCSCGERSEWLRHHGQDFVKLVARTTADQPIRDDAHKRIIEDDYALTSDYSLFVPGGGATYMKWSFGAAADMNVADYHMTMGVIENGLLQYWQLKRLNSLLSQSRDDSQRLQILQYGLFDGLEELRSSQFNYGTAGDLATSVLRSNGGDELYKKVLERAAALQQLISARRAVLTSQRSGVLASVALVLAALLGFPAIWNTAQLLASPPLAQLLQSVGITVVADIANMVALIVYLGLVVFAILFVSRKMLAGVGRRRRRSIARLRGHVPGPGARLVVEVEERKT